MANVSFNQSLNGLNTTTIFTAPATGTYYVNGQLQLPNPTASGSQSAVVAVVKQNSSTVFTSNAGDHGFQIAQLPLSLGDVVSVVLSSSAAIDQPSNSVRGVVTAGNAF